MKMIFAICAALALPCGLSAQPLDLSKLAKVAEVDPRFQSYNVEMVEVTGGRFWAPYGGPKSEIYRMRPPLDLAAPRIRALAKPLGPVYMRVSGTWANSTYLPLAGEKIDGVPAGFKQLLTRDQWRGVIAFAKAVDAKIVTSFPATEGTRDASGSWKPDQAQRLLDLTREAGGTIYGAELFNEPTVPPFGGYPKGFSAADFARDFRVFRAWARKAAPAMKLMGPGGASEGTMLKHNAENEARGFLESDTLLSGNPDSLDVFTYHFYGSASVRCGTAGGGTKETALAAAWLDKTVEDNSFYTALRDKYEPRKPIWLNETAQAACGGSPWAATFLDSFRYLNQLGALAQRGVQVVAHNTLAASDYGLIDYDTMMPRPNYWAAVLWRRTMGATVLAAPPSPAPQLRLYAHCRPDRRGGVGLLAINTGDAPQTLPVGRGAQAWTMRAERIDSGNVTVNGAAPAIDARGKVFGLAPVAVGGGFAVPGKSIAFVTVPGAGNPACR